MAKPTNRASCQASSRHQLSSVWGLLMRDAAGIAVPHYAAAVAVTLNALAGYAFFFFYSYYWDLLLGHSWVGDISIHWLGCLLAMSARKDTLSTLRSVWNVLRGQSGTAQTASQTTAKSYCSARQLQSRLTLQLRSPLLKTSMQHLKTSVGSRNTTLGAGA